MIEPPRAKSQVVVIGLAGAVTVAAITAVWSVLTGLSFGLGSALGVAAVIVAVVCIGAVSYGWHRFASRHR